MADNWHDLTLNPSDIPDPGERVNICVGYTFVGEGYLKLDGLWYRYCDLDPVEKFMNQPVVGWMPLPQPMRMPVAERRKRQRETASPEQCD